MSATQDGGSAYWAKLMTERIGRIGPPFEPSREDVAALEQAVAGWVPEAPALMLGITRDIATMRWPAAARLVAVDKAVGAVATFSVGVSTATPVDTVAADWRRMPLRNSSVACVLGDGSYAAVESAADQHEVSRELVRVLKPGGVLALRVYVRPDTPESPARVFDDLRAGRIAGFSAFKLRLLMATPARPDGSVRLGDTWAAWAQRAIDRADLAAATGWARETIDTIDAYRDKPVRYVFHTLAGTRAVLAPYFVETGLVAKPYELGERCPTLLMRAR